MKINFFFVSFCSLGMTSVCEIKSGGNLYVLYTRHNLSVNCLGLWEITFDYFFFHCTRDIKEEELPYHLLVRVYRPSDTDVTFSSFFAHILRLRNIFYSELFLMCLIFY